MLWLRLKGQLAQPGRCRMADLPEDSIFRGALRSMAVGGFSIAGKMACTCRSVAVRSNRSRTLTFTRYLPMKARSRNLSHVADSFAILPMTIILMRNGLRWEADTSTTTIRIQVGL